MTAPSPPPRLHVLLRPEARTAVVLRRGPARVFCVLGWDLATDRFEVGQWCRHKLYPRRCDVSPDGRFLVTFALDGRWRARSRGAWTALSFAPYLKALRLWPQGDTWGGGGLFFSTDQLPPGCEPAPQPPLPDDVHLALGAFASYPNRLARDGWAADRGGFTRPVGRGWTLRKLLHAEPRESHQLLGPRGEVVELPRWEWAEHDVARGRVVWAEAGVVHAARVHGHGLGEPATLFDTRDLVFTPIEAPYRCETVFVE